MAETHEIWQRYKTKGDLQARQEIIRKYTYLAKYVVDRLLIRPSAVLGYDDLLSHAVVGLIDAVEKFDLAKDVKFETYAVVRIRGSVLDAVKKLDWTPRSVRASEQELRREFARLEAKLGRPATDEEVSESLGIDIDELNGTLADIGQSAVASLEGMMLSSEESSISGFLLQADPENDPLLAAELGEKKRVLAEAIDNLPEKEKLVISLYYKEDLTLKEIAAVLGVTESRACQLHSKAVVRLQGKLAQYKDVLLTAA